MRLISWNIGHPTKGQGIEKVIRALREASPDIVALQEIPRRVPQALLEGLIQMGLQVLPPLIPTRGWGLLTASKWPLKPLDGAVFEIPKDEEGFYRGRHPAPDGTPARLLSVRVERPQGMFELYNVHVPPGSQAGWRKIDTLRAVAKRMAVPSALPRILCGDFNEPRTELAGGGVESGANYNIYARSDRNRWQTAVESIFVGLPEIGVRDVFRAVHGDRVQNLVSHRLRNSGNPRRYDHVFASKVFQPKVACYLPEESCAGISDHAPAEVIFRD